MRRLPELLVLRHGETEWNRAGRFQGERDSPLTRLGRAQAEALGRRRGARGGGAGSPGGREAPARGRAPPPPRRRAPAEARGRLLGAEGVSARTHAAWTSPQGRAVETAQV